MQEENVSRVADFVHGKDGLGDCLSEQEKATSGAIIRTETAAKFIVRMARDQPDLTLICLGPLTNLALAVKVPSIWQYCPCRYSAVWAQF